MRARIVAVGSLLALATAAAHAPGLSGRFTNWDDDWLVVRNPWIRSLDGESLSAIAAPFGPPAVREQLGAEYLPLRDLSYALDHALFGLDPAGFHLTNLLLHVVAMLALAAAAWRITRRPVLAVVAAAVFALHPVQVESVAWISARKDVLAGAFGALAALAWSVARDPGHRRSLAYGLSLLLVGAALLSKYTAVVWPVLLVLGEWLAPEPRPGEGAWDRFRRALPLAPHLALAAVFTFAVAVPVGSRALIREWYGSGLGATTLTVAGVVRDYVGLLAVPEPLQAAVDYPVLGATAPRAAGLAAAEVLLLLGAAGGLLGLALVRGASPGARAAAAGVLLFAAALAPTANLPFPIGTLYAERYLYLPVLGLGIALGALAEGWAAAAAGGRRAALLPLAGLLLLGLAYGARTSSRSRIWHDSEVLWRDVLAKDPGHHTALFNLGLHRFEEALALDGPRREERLREAELLFRTALAHRHRSYRTEPSRAEVALGHALSALGRLDQALAAYGRALDLARRSAQGLPPGRMRDAAASFAADILVGRGQALDRAGREEEARADFAEAVRVRPDLPAAHLNLGILLGRAAATEEAARVAEARLLAAAELDPRGIEPLLNLAALRNDRGRPDEALADLDRALSRDPRSADARRDRALVLANLGRETEGRAALEALVSDPSPAARAAGAVGLAKLERQAGRWEVAERTLRAALRDPGLAGTSAGRALREALADLYLDVASAFLGRKEPERALRTLEAAIGVGATGARTLLREAAVAAAKARLAAGKAEDLAAADRALRSALRADPSAPAAGECWLALAEVSRRRGDLASMGAALAEALALPDPAPDLRVRIRRESARFEVARALVAWENGVGGLPAARAALERARELDPDLPALARAGMEIEAGGGSGKGADPAAALRWAEALERAEGELTAMDRQALLRLHGESAARAGKEDRPEERQRHLRASFAHARSIARAEPGSVQAWENLASVCRALGRLDLAAEAYAEALRLRPDDPTVREKAGKVHLALGLRTATRDPERAVFHLGRYLSLADPPLDDMGRRVLAILRAQAAARAEERPLLDEAEALLAAGKAADAVEKAKAALAVRPSREALDLAARSWEALGQWEDAAAAWRRILALAFSEDAAVRLGEALSKAGKPDAAIEAVETARAAVPGDVPCPDVDSWLETRRGEVHTQACRAGEAALATARAAPEAERADRHAEAVREWRRATRHRPEDAAAHLALAESLEGAGDRDGARAEYALARDLAVGEGDRQRAVRTAAAQALARLGG